jgi:hypothetical protein
LIFYMTYKSIYTCCVYCYLWIHRYIIQCKYLWIPKYWYTCLYSTTMHISINNTVYPHVPTRVTR